MELQRYNQTFEERVETFEEEAENKLRIFRQQCIRNFIDKFNRHQREWDLAFRELLIRSQQDDIQTQSKIFEDTKSLELALNRDLGITDLGASENEKKQETIEDDPDTSNLEPNNNIRVAGAVRFDLNDNKIDSDRVKTEHPQSNLAHKTIDPFPEELSDYFTNNLLVKEYVNMQRELETERHQFMLIDKDPSLKQFRSDISLFIRTQINSISNSDKEHLNSKTRMLYNLFIGQQVSYLNRVIQTSQHPNGQSYSMDLAAQTFVTVGTRLVNSVPAIAKSMATVINDIIIKNNLQQFRKYILGNLQERCPFLVPFYPRRSDFTSVTRKEDQSNEMKYKIACGYNYDSKTKSLESSEKYYARMRSMVLIYASILAQHEDKSLSWTWLVSFLSLTPEPVITSTILEAYLQEISKPMSRAFGRQYKKLIDFIKTDYMYMIEQVTEKSERQSLIKLKNQLDDESNLFAPPEMGSIFKPMRI